MILNSRSYATFALLTTLFATGSIAQAQSARRFTEWTSPTAGSEPLFARALSDEAVFFTERLAGKVGRLNPETNGITEWTVSGFPHDMTFGQGGVLFANQSGSIARLMPGTSKQTSWTVGGIPEHLEVFGNTIYYADGSGQIGRLNLTTGTLRKWAIPGADGANGIDVASDGRYIAYLGAKIGILDTTTNTFRQWAQPGNPGNGHLRFSGRYVFFGSNNTTPLNRLDPAGSKVRSWSLPSLSGIGDLLIAGEAEKDDEAVKITFTETIGKIAAFDTDTPGVDTGETPTVTVVAPVNTTVIPVTIVVKKTDTTVVPVRTLVTAVTTGEFVEWAVPTAGSLPGGISRFEDDSLLFTERTGNKIGILSDER